MKRKRRNVKLVHSHQNDQHLFNLLPDEILTEIFSFVGFEQLARLRKVNRQFRNVIDNFGGEIEFKPMEIDRTNDEDNFEDDVPTTHDEIAKLNDDLSINYVATYPESPLPSPTIPALLKFLTQTKVIGPILQALIIPVSTERTGVYSDNLVEGYLVGHPVDHSLKYWKETVSYGSFKDIERTLNAQREEITLRQIPKQKKDNIDNIEDANTRSGKRFRNA